MDQLGYIFEGGSGLVLSPMAERVARFLMEPGNGTKIWPREEIAKACKFNPLGRSCDTYIAEIRKALGKIKRIASGHGYGYAWVGDPVPLVPQVKFSDRARPEPSVMRMAVVPRSEVARQLGISTSDVEIIERRALAKLKASRSLRNAWEKLKRDLGKVSYDPFHQIWLYDIAREA